MADVRATAVSTESAPALQQYVRQKQAVGQSLRVLDEFLKRRGSESRRADCHELFVKLAEDRFTLAVVGQFKRGKSSLMNAIIGRELLPTGLLPLTSVVTILRFGPRDRVLLPSDRLSFDQELPISALRDYVTEEGNPGNQRQIKAVYVEVSSPFLRRGLEFVDTPGVGSAVGANTATTYQFLPHCDAVLFVTALDSPLTEAEVVLLRDLRQYVRKLFFVVNKCDLLQESDRATALEYLRGTLRSQILMDDFRIFPVSARAALAAKMDGPQQEPDAGGIGDLEAELGRFLAEDRSTTFLLAIVNHATRLLEAERRDMEQKLAIAPSNCSATRLMSKPEQRARHAVLRSRLEALREGILAGQPLAEAPAADPTGNGFDWVVPSVSQPELNVEKPAVHGCTVCDHLAKSLFDFFRHFQYQLATEESTQRLFAEDLGFCPLHTWQLATLSSTLGLSAGLPRLMQRLAAELAAAALEPEVSAIRVARLVARTASCRACCFVREAEKQYIARMADLLAQPEYRDRFRRSEGVCLRHLGVLVAVLPNQESSRFLLAQSAARFQEAAEDMLSYVIKREATRRALLNQNEQEANVRALTYIAGHHYLASSSLPDAEF
ncbi:MAG TPA: DUF6062 family protein [Pirellulales bacterium]|nr:DUF6062 family protein [Pirellulales bacterium]